MLNDFSETALPKMRFKSKEEAYLKILRAIVESYNNIDKSKGLENKIRNRIVFYLQNTHPFFAPLFQFELINIVAEYYSVLSETKTNRSDICFSLGKVNGIIVGNLIVECKRLFQQPSKNKPYLDDGLIKFIDLRYAKTNEYSAMVGFVVSGDIDTIFANTIQNTEKFYPTKQNQLVQNPIDSNWKHSFVSFHERTDNSEIKIYHLLFEFKD